MSLVQKYRPQKLSEVVGQRLTITALTNSIKQQTFHSAYLFSGARGTGKTSTARAFAKSLNCETGITTEPCGVCDTCKAIQAGVGFGVQEIDCATNNGVDHARELVSKVCYSGYSRYKVYILDEAHNLTKQAFDALLKTLEEPGQKVVFILITTELSKVPKTIQSRCQTFNFTPLKDYELRAYCQQILNKENADIAPDLLNILVSTNDGILRDALTLLDKVILSEAKSPNDIYELMGVVPAVDVIRLLNACVQQDYTLIYKELKEIFKSGVDPLQVLNEISNFTRNAIASQSEPIDYSIMTCDSKTYQAARLWGCKIPISKLVAAQIMMREAEIDFGAAKIPKLFLEATLLKLSQVFAGR
jgi:DNA polymerase-3 subunit gamma/tau